MQFRVSVLEPIAAKAKKLLKYYATEKRHDELKVKMQKLQGEIEATESEMDTVLGDGDFKSVVGIDCQV